MVSSIALEDQQSNLIIFICLHTVTWLNISIWSVDGTLRVTNSTGQNGHGSDDNKEALHSLQISRTGALP